MEFKTPKQKQTTGNSSDAEKQIPEDDESSVPQKEEIINEKPKVLPVLKYSEPEWSGVPDREYFLTILKNGKEIDR